MITACREAATQHWAASEICDNRELEDALKQMNRDRSAAFEDLAPEVMNDDDVPTEPTHEKELPSTIGTRVKAALSNDEVSRLLDDCGSTEARVVEATRAALRHADDAALQGRLKDLRNDANSRIDALRRRFAGPK